MAEAAAVLSQASHAVVRSYSTRDFGRECYTGAISVQVPERHADPPGVGVEVVIGPGSTQFDILRIAASDAVNYDKQTEDLVRVLQDWDRRFGIDIFAAETDTVQLKLTTIDPAGVPVVGLNIGAPSAEPQENRTGRGGLADINRCHLSWFGCWSGQKSGPSATSEFGHLRTVAARGF
jgi:hypothetical protein